MSARHGLLLVTLLLGCQRERMDPRVAEVTSPARITVRVVDLPEPVDCSAAGDLKAQLKCRLTRAPRVGCTYVEVGSMVDQPIRRTGTVDRSACNALPGNRVKTVDAPLRRVQVEFDDAGTRSAVVMNGEAWVLYLHDGELVESRFRGAAPAPSINTSVYRDDVMLRLSDSFPVVNDAGVDWSLVPPLLSVIPAHPGTFSEDEIDAAFARTPDAARVYGVGFAAALESKKLTPRDEAWGRMSRRLDDEARKNLREAMLSLLRRGDEDALQWAEADEEIPREQLVEALQSAMDDMQYASPLLVEALFRLQPDVAAPLACKQLENHEFGDMGGDWSIDAYSELSTAFALIARFKVQCPWVVPMLLRSPCSAELQRMPSEKEDEASSELPLANEQERARALQLIFTNPADYTAEDEAFLDDGNHWGWLLLAAAEAQGPLPDEFLRRNARRTYRTINRFKGSGFDDPCANAQQSPAEWACRMPLSLNWLERESCRLEIDDEARTLTVSPSADWVKPAE